MKRIIATLLALTITLFLSGCMGGGAKNITTTVKIDPETGKEIKTMVETESSFWKSENQQMHYEYETNRTDKATEVALAKLANMERAAARRAAMNLPPEARAYADALDMVMTAQVQTSVPASGMPTPKNMADVASGNLIPLVKLGIQVVDGVFDLDIGGPLSGGGEGNTSLEDMVVGGDLFINSERNDKYDLRDSASFAPTNNPTFSWTYETNEGNAFTQGSESPASTANPTESGTSLF